MHTVPESAATVQFDTALRTLAGQARSRYAGEAARIDRGLVLALNQAVTLLPTGGALVQSQSEAEIVYTVQHGQCDCPDASRAPEGRCKHRWAACLARKAQAEVAQHSWFATYTTPWGDARQGIATWDAATQRYLFVPEDGAEPCYPAETALALGGNVALYEAKRAEDEAAGGLVALICGYGH